MQILAALVLIVGMAYAVPIEEDQHLKGETGSFALEEMETAEHHLKAHKALKARRLIPVAPAHPVILVKAKKVKGFHKG